MNMAKKTDKVDKGVSYRCRMWWSLSWRRAKMSRAHWWMYRGTSWLKPKFGRARIVGAGVTVSDKIWQMWKRIVNDYSQKRMLSWYGEQDVWYRCLSWLRCLWSTLRNELRRKLRGAYMSTWTWMPIISTGISVSISPMRWKNWPKTRECPTKVHEDALHWRCFARPPFRAWLWERGNCRMAIGVVTRKR